MCKPFKLGNKAYIRCGDSASVMCYLLAKSPSFAGVPIYAVMQGNPMGSGHYFVLVGDPDGFASMASSEWDDPSATFPTSKKCLTVDLWGANLVADRAWLKTNTPDSYATLRAGLIKSKPTLANYPGRAFVSCERKDLTFQPVWPIPEDQADDAPDMD